jgi:DtxR family Mn-dependent transcriptional regulator
VILQVLLYLSNFDDMLSYTEENYLKALLHLTMENSNTEEAGTNDIAAELNVRPATTNDMLKKLKEKKLVNYEKYGKSSLTKEGKKIAIEVVRKHRLWETFLYEKLEFTWDEVHEVAEQLEHIQSAKLVDKLDKFLNYPAFDPHGDAIPTAKGELKVAVKKTLNEEEIGHTCTMVGVKDNSAAFLQYVDKVGLSIKEKIKVLSKQPYDELIEIEVKGKKSSVSPKFAENIIVVCEECSKRSIKVRKV